VVGCFLNLGSTLSDFHIYFAMDESGVERCAVQVKTRYLTGRMQRLRGR